MLWISQGCCEGEHDGSVLAEERIERHVIHAVRMVIGHHEGS